MGVYRELTEALQEEFGGLLTENELAEMSNGLALGESMCRELVHHLHRTLTRESRNLLEINNAIVAYERWIVARANRMRSHHCTFAAQREPSLANPSLRKWAGRKWPTVS